APDPLAASRARTEPLRDLPGARKKERTWRDEANERLKDRKRRRQAGARPELPLSDGAPGSAAPIEPTSGTGPAPAPAPRTTQLPPPPAPEPVSLERALDAGLRGERDTAPYVREDALPDLPLRSADPQPADTTDVDAIEAEPEAPLASLPPPP